ncbi:hypothetical protein AMELA_G00080460 [Ameiurus melas]|uniref:E3 ubiquitin-protein ligase DCST1-like C-terminal domain-containing protein n=1 Tax=Ameiurus melas TaxID=219545 RepID=A0A7J6B035_AMEME|nr:hypothetical protein AMELA_G00080460 [Ameiurus melas]
MGLCDRSCLACGKAVKVENSSDVYTCSTQNCTGCFCMQCFRVMGNICAVCTGPLTFQEDSEYELDSSDEEQVNLREVAMTSPHINQNADRMRLIRRKPVNTEDPSDSDTSNSEPRANEDQCHNLYAPQLESIV